MSSKRKEKEKKKKRKRKEKEKKKKKKIKRIRKEKEKEEKLQRFALKPEQGPRSIWKNPLKLGALSQLVGSRRLSARYMGGWVEFSKL